MSILKVLTFPIWFPLKLLWLLVKAVTLAVVVVLVVLLVLVSLIILR
jgi:hypothetical protein